MKRPLVTLHLVLSVTALLLIGLPARAVTFTNNTAISFNDTNYDGLDIVVTNCTLTVDGLHTFASLQVLNGANLTHSYSSNGLVQEYHTITNEPHVLSATNVATLLSSNVIPASIIVEASVGYIYYPNNGSDYLIGTDTNGMTTLLLTTNSAIEEGSLNLVTYDVLDGLVAAGLSLTVTGDVTVAQGGAINTDGKGYGGALGPGPGVSAGSPLSGSGAGHGGYGGQSGALDGVGMPYDSIQQPVFLGSGGGSGLGGVGGAGGGSVKLAVGGNLRIDGTVSANGANGLNDRSGGGAGGGIWLTCSNLFGAGLLSANGGAGDPSQGGGGAGGRISLQFAANTFSGLSPASGGNGYTRGGAGTVYIRTNGQTTGQLLVDNGGSSGMSTPVYPGEAFGLTAQGGAVLSLSSGVSLTLGSLLVASNAWISLSNNTPPTITVTGNATIQTGGGILADGAGSPGGSGTGAGRNDTSAYTGGGGGYGGYGASGGGTEAYGGSTYGSVTAPTTVGSGGGSYYTHGLGGAGGGAIRLTVNGMLWLDGRISANGNPAIGEGSGGGSGGSVWLTVGTLTGSGTISANGGAGNGFGLTGGGGGGGGRIAIQYATDLFFGVTSAWGGSGSAAGGAGTIYTLANNESWGQLLVDNDGQSGTNTTWSQTGTIDLTVQGGAVVSPPSSQTIGTLLVASNGWVSIASQTLTVTGNATVQAGGGIIADSMGSAGGVGTGAGRYASTSLGYIGGGGGYGGYGAAGGAPAGYSAYGGSIYGSLTAPAAVGSGGGTLSPYAIGGAGGGLIRLNVTGVLEVNGRISAAGGSGITPSGGGGSGGGIALTVGTLAGAGIISANGGAGNYLGGGGGGGCIAILYGAYDFSGVVSAYGGGGYAWGGAGTVYTKANSASWGQLAADNGGQSGTNTTWTSTSTIDLTVRGGAVVSPPSSQTIGTLLVASNGWVSIGSQTLTITGNATVQAGGGISADGTGNAAGSGAGPGGSYSSIGGGGGHGGYGASGEGTATSGGTTYDSITAPTALGSGGGGISSPAVGGAGGGAIRLTVDGTLEVDGSLTARGLPGTGSGGGGSGGSIYLTVGALTGSGVISANGGAGCGFGGGGGGGRIAVTPYSSTLANTFSGLMSAYGGNGYARGGAGTIYTTSTVEYQPALIVVDNGGQAGANTSLSSGGSVNVTVQGGAWLSLSSSQEIETLLVASNGWVNLGNQELTMMGNATIQAGGGIIADGMGSAGNTGTGPGQSSSSESGGGGGHGGYGGSGLPYGGYSANGGNTYGSVTAPTELGSGGGGMYSPVLGGAGGGLIHLSVTGTLEVDGTVSARGLAGTGSGGGGSGGSIYLTVGALTGVGVISANGGAGGGSGGGGGGGRIAITSTGANTFAGLLSAYGGSGYAAGGAGTIFTAVGPISAAGQIVLDNGGQTGTNTSWPSGVTTASVTVQDGAVVSLPAGSQTIANLVVASNGWLSVATSQGSAVTLTVSGTATIQAGGGITADGAGYSSGGGSGAGGSSSTSSGGVGGGGANGGYGAASGGTPAAHGGVLVGSLTAPVAGSGGGAYSGTGGAGGGALNLTVTGTLEVDGRISAAGGAGVSDNSGGGAGGGLTLNVGTLTGVGVIAANGGAGNGLGGGGGGGRIAITYTANAFSGLMSAYGGGGYAWGGAGTIYTKANNSSWGQVLVDNGGQAGTNTSWSSPITIDLTVKCGAVVIPQSQTMGNLLVASNAWISLSSQTLTVTSNATVQAGGGIIADSNGYTGGDGSGAGRFISTSSGYFGGGGGYGGFGAASGGTTPALGGSPYGVVTGPLSLGSGGGGLNNDDSQGGAGGGVVHINVTGALLVDGRISANGGAGIGQGSGGGSGGGVWLTAGTLAGAGTIAANGGAGNELGGGGGGGCIALQYGVNAFQGIISAYGGGGYASGGAGTLYTKANSQSVGQMLVDNGGQNGTNTPIASLNPFNLSPFNLTVQNGAVASLTTSPLLLSNLFVNAGGTLTCPTQTVLNVTVLDNATVEPGGLISLDGSGFGPGAGPGAGLSSESIGSGAGHGGHGGASTVLPGGLAYDSAQQPVDLGSGGGLGWLGTGAGGAGGGAILFTVGGALTVNGRISAEGEAALSDDGGGGSGGSIWLAAGALLGTGAIAADGGAGELYDGGGGGGGRVALYSPVNAFSGVVSAAGAPGASPGQNGSIYTASYPPPPQVVFTTPIGALNAAVSSFYITFSTVVNPASVSPATVTLTAPGGVAVSNLVASAVNPYQFLVNCPQQIAPGNYLITVGPQVLDLLGQPMSQVYTGAFSIVWSTVQGAVTDTNGLPVPGVVLQVGGELLASTTTDTNGNYLLSLPPAGYIQITPLATNLMFVPWARTYNNVTGALSNQNYLAVNTIAPALAVQFQTNTCVLNWYGISGVTYQPLYSTNLDEGWLPYDGALSGTNGPMQLLIPANTAPIMFFRMSATD